MEEFKSGYTAELEVLVKKVQDGYWKVMKTIS